MVGKGDLFPVEQLFKWCFYIKRFAGFGKNIDKNLL